MDAKESEDEAHRAALDGNPFDCVCNDPRLNWTAANDGCEARADLAAELLEQQFGFRVEKIWATPPYNGHLTVYLDEAGTERVEWLHHVAAVVKNASGDRVFDPSLFRQAVAVDAWQERVARDSMEGVSFVRASRLAYHRPYSYEGDSIAREKMLVERRQTLDQASRLTVLDTLTATAQYRRAQFIDRLMRDDPERGRRLAYCRNHFMYFAHHWITNRPVDEFLEKLALVGYWYGIPESRVKEEFDVEEPLLQVYLQERYWEHMVTVLRGLEEISKTLQNLSNKSADAQQWQEFMEMEEVYNVWMSPFGRRLWAKFGFEPGPP